jgi:hypothetical protein
VRQQSLREPVSPIRRNASTKFSRFQRERKDSAGWKVLVGAIA